MEEENMITRLGTIVAVLIGWFGINSQLWAPPPTVGIPEIDSTGVLTGLAVLAGVLTVVAERRRQKK
jgi:hypothetical protein